MPTLKSKPKRVVENLVVEEKVSEPVESPAMKEGSLIDFVLEPFKQWYDFARPNWKGYWFGLLKIAFTSFFVNVALFILLLLVLAGIVFAAGGFGEILRLNVVPLIAIVLLLFVILVVGVFLIGWITASISSTAVIYTNARFLGGEFSIWGSFMKIKGRVLRYMLIEYGLYLIVMLPFLLIFGLIIGVIAISLFGFSGLVSSSPTSTLPLLGAALFSYFLLYIFVMIFFLFVSLFNLIFRFFAQFWGYGFLLEDLGVIDALKKSVRIVRNKPLETLVFCIIWFVAVAVASLPLSFFSFFINIGFRLFPYFYMSSLGLLGNVLLYAAIFLVAAFVSIFLSTLAKVVSIPIHYLFWKKVKGQIDTVQ